jgi:hypothetical protein
MQAIRVNAGDCQDRKDLKGDSLILYYPNNLLERGRKTTAKDSAVN